MFKKELDILNYISGQASNLVDLTSKRIFVSTASRTKLITVTSGKGGVGKSTFGANIAYLLTRKGHKAIIVDADIGLANMQVMLNLKPEYTIFDYVDAKVTLKQAILQTQYKNLSLLAGKSGYQYSNHSNSLILTRVINDIIELDEFDFILVDTGAGLNSYVKEFLEISSNILAVTTTDPSAITDLYALVKMLSKNKNSLMLCFNHTKKYEIGETVTKFIDNLAKKNVLNSNFMLKYLGNVQSSQTISTTSKLRKLFTCEFLNDEVTKELNLVVDKLLENMEN